MNSSNSSLHQNAIARAIAELIYEEVLELKVLTSKKGSVLELYEFDFKMGLWGSPWIDPYSLVSVRGEKLRLEQFLIDCGQKLKWEDHFLDKFLEENLSSLFSEAQQNALGFPGFSDLLEMNETQRSRFYPGHPKIIARKSRQGWSSEDAKLYAPESQNPFQLFWLLIHRDLCHSSGKAHNSYTLDQSFNDEERLQVQVQLSDNPNYLLVPVHPWQWSEKIEILFQQEILDGLIKPLGLLGDDYLPQISLRSLSNHSRPLKNDLKLSVSILNTSAIRGLNHDQLDKAPLFSAAIKELIARDEYLQQQGVQVQAEPASLFVAHPYFNRKSAGPYQLKELLGVSWRESLASLTNELCLMSGGLQTIDPKTDESLLEYMIQKSGLGTGPWLELYAQKVVNPLFHLMSQYGIGVVAHGQNIQVGFKNFAPSFLVFKDFGGDIRCSETAPESLKKISSAQHLPPQYIVHDLFTGHFVSVLRFLSLQLSRKHLLEEERFYQIFQNALKTYCQNFPENSALYPLFEAKMPKVLLNPVRFKYGYSDQNQRFSPMLGTALDNPLSSTNTKTKTKTKTNIREVYEL